MRCLHEVDQVIVHDVAEEEVKSDANDPAQQSLIVGVHSVVESAEGDEEDEGEGHAKRDSSCVLLCIHCPAH